jgi:hypothetical protein
LKSSRAGRSLRSPARCTPIDRPCGARIVGRAGRMKMLRHASWWVSLTFRSRDTRRADRCAHLGYRIRPTTGC